MESVAVWLEVGNLVDQAISVEENELLPQLRSFCLG